MLQDTRLVAGGVDEHLDMLIPPPLSRPKKLLLGSLLLMLSAAVAYLNLGGYLVPQPINGISFGSSAHLTTDEAGGLVAATVLIPNNSNRTVRVTSVALDAAGAELVDVQILPDIHEVGRDIAGGHLPVTIAPGESSRLVLWLRPTSCEDPVAPWGVAVPTFDFGEGAFPPFSSSIRIDDDPIWEEGDQASVLVGDRFVEGGGPLSLACEVLR